MSTKWIDEDRVTLAISGQPGFLVSIKHQGCKEVYSLRDEPARKNQSHEPTLAGWCGETNNTNVNAEGLWKVIAVSPNGRRAKIEEVTDLEEMAAVLELMGYPELMPEGD